MEKKFISKNPFQFQFSQCLKVNTILRDLKTPLLLYLFKWNRDFFSDTLENGISIQKPRHLIGKTGKQDFPVDMLKCHTILRFLLFSWFSTISWFNALLIFYFKFKAVVNSIPYGCHNKYYFLYKNLKNIIILTDFVFPPTEINE